MRSGSTRGYVGGVLVGVGGALILVVLLVLQSMTSAGVFGARSGTVTVTTSVATLISASASSTSSAGNCLLPIGPSATTAPHASGTMVTYPSGDQVYFPEYSCPQPVSNKTYQYEAITSPFRVATNEYRLALAAVTNPKFASAENGTTYIYTQPGYWPISSFSRDNYEYNLSGYYFDVVFFHYSDSTHDWCGPNTPRRIVLSGIEVGFFARFGSGWDMSNPTMHVMSSVDLGQVNVCVIA